MWASVLFLRTSPVKQYSYENDFSGVFDALHQSFLVVYISCQTLPQVQDNKTNTGDSLQHQDPM